MNLLQPRTCSGGPGPPSTTWPPPPSTAPASLAGQPATATAAAGGTRGARGASRSTRGARGGRGTGTSHNSGTGSTGGTGGRGGGKGTGGGKGHGDAGHGGAGDGHGTTGGDRTPDPEMIRRSQESHQRAQNTQNRISEENQRYESKTVSSDHVQTLSGWGGKTTNRPSEFQKPNVDTVLAKQEEIGHPTKRAGFYDNGVAGSFNASHAERQLSLTAKEPAIGISKDLCKDCQGYFTRLAQHEGRDWYITDPDCTWVFYADGTITKL